jgi:PAS domain S-box-containing protein
MIFYAFNANAEVRSLKQGCRNNRKILLLNSYHQGFKWTDDIVAAVFSSYKDSFQYHLFVEYMDSKRNQTSGYFYKLNEFYRLKYKNVGFDGIICSDNNALDFYLQYGDSIFGKVPIVFCGVNNPEYYKSRVDTSRIFGVEERIDIYSTLKAAMHIQPDLKEVIVIGDKTLLFPIFYNQFLDAVNKLQPLKHRLIIAEDKRQLRDTLKSLNPEGKAIYLLSLYFNQNFPAREMAAEARHVLRGINIPVYSNWDFLMPDIIVGGKLESGFQQGKAAAQLMMKLNIDTTFSAPFATVLPHEFVFDFNQMRKFKIPVSLVPEGSILAFKKESVWDRYSTEITISSLVFSVLLIIILLLVSTILQRKRMELELLESEYRLELAIEGANQGLWDVNLLSKNIYINKKFAQLLGYNSPKELQLSFENWKKIFHPNDLLQLYESFFMHRTKKTNSLNCEIRMINKQGNYQWMAIHGKISESDQEKPVRFTGSILDISNQKEYESQLRQAKEKAEESDRLKSSFLANMSHEIRTPMNAIIGFTDLIHSEDISEEERKTYLNLIKNSSESLLALINDIIDISKIESGQLMIVKEIFDLNDLIDNMTKMSQTIILNSGKNIAFAVNKGVEDDRFLIYSDALRLEQVILNLLTNAIKFTFEGQIDLGYRVENETIHFYVADTGIGIADEHKKVVFERFRQGDESMAKRFGGTGLGLTISRSLVNLLGGELDVKSTLGKGSVFSFYIPLEIKKPVAGIHD